MEYESISNTSYLKHVTGHVWVARSLCIDPEMDYTQKMEWEVEFVFVLC